MRGYIVSMAKFCTFSPLPRHVLGHSCRLSPPPAEPLRVEDRATNLHEVRILGCGFCLATPILDGACLVGESTGQPYPGRLLTWALGLDRATKNRGKTKRGNNVTPETRLHDLLTSVSTADLLSF